MMTIDERDQETLFDRNVYISEAIQSALPPSYLIRPLRRDDDEKGFIELLSQLSIVGSITQKSFKGRCLLFIDMFLQLTRQFTRSIRST